MFLYLYKIAKVVQVLTVLVMPKLPALARYLINHFISLQVWIHVACRSPRPFSREFHLLASGSIKPLKQSNDLAFKADLFIFA